MLTHPAHYVSPTDTARHLSSFPHAETGTNRASARAEVRICRDDQGRRAALGALGVTGGAGGAGQPRPVWAALTVRTRARGRARSAGARNRAPPWPGRWPAGFRTRPRHA